MAEESSTFIGEITDDFNYAWKFVKPRASELREYFTTSTIYKGQMVYGWVRKFPNYEDKVKEVSALTRSHATRADAESIHDTWDLKTLISKYGADATIRELKKRCDAGAVVGCSMYLNFSTHLISTALGEETPGSKGKSDAAKDPAFRGPALGMLEVAEGSKWVNKIEALHEKYPDERIPKNEIEDLKDEFMEALEQRAGRQIPRLPGDASPQDIADSKRIAEALAKGTFIKKPQPQERTSAPAPAAMPPGPISTERIKHAIIETEEDELTRITRRIEELKNEKAARQTPITTAPRQVQAPSQPKPTPIKGLDLMEDEIRQKMEEIRARRAAGQGQAGEGKGMYGEADIKKGEKRHYADLHFLIGIEQDTMELKKLLPVIENTPSITKFDKEILKEEIIDRLQLLLEHEEVGKPRAGARCAEPAHDYSKTGNYDTSGELCPECGHRMEKGICALHGTKEQILRHRGARETTGTNTALEALSTKLIKKHPGLKIFLYETFGDIKLANLIVPKDQQGQGIGTSALKELVSFADENNKRIIITPGVADDRHGTTSRSRLVSFYKRFGFVENKGKDASIIESMFRVPHAASNTKAERINLARQMASTIPKRENEPGTTEITVGGYEHMSKEKRIELAKKIAHGEVRETADVITAPADYTQWTFADFEPFIRNLDDTEELRELYEFIGTSENISEKEGDTLRGMVDKRIKDIDAGRK